MFSMSEAEANVEEYLKPFLEQEIREDIRWKADPGPETDQLSITQDWEWIEVP